MFEDQVLDDDTTWKMAESAIQDGQTKASQWVADGCGTEGEVGELLTALLAEMTPDDVEEMALTAVQSAATILFAVRKLKMHVGNILAGGGVVPDN